NLGGMMRVTSLCVGVALWLPLLGQAQNGAKKEAKEFEVEGKLTADDPRDKVRKDRPHKVHEYKMKKGVVYVIDMVSQQPKDFDPYLRLEDSAGKNLAEDDDSGGFPHARIMFQAPKDDTFRIICTAVRGVGDYVLTVRKADEKDTPKKVYDVFDLWRMWED